MEKLAAIAHHRALTKCDEQLCPYCIPTGNWDHVLLVIVRHFILYWFQRSETVGGFVEYNGSRLVVNRLGTGENEVTLPLH